MQQLRKPRLLLSMPSGGDPPPACRPRQNSLICRQAVYGGGGDSARIVIAPASVKECYHYTVKSFQYAEKYQTPVILLTDFFLHNRVESIDELSADADDIKDWNVYPPEADNGNYRRYRRTESGISPRAIPGMEGFIFTTTGLEHTEKGLPDYTPSVHMQMTKKRHQKMQVALADLPAPEVHGPEGKLDVGIISWGSTFGSALEAARLAQNGEKKSRCLENYIHISLPQRYHKRIYGPMRPSADRRIKLRRSVGQSDRSSPSKRSKKIESGDRHTDITGRYSGPADRFIRNG